MVSKAKSLTAQRANADLDITSATTNTWDSNATFNGYNQITGENLANATDLAFRVTLGTVDPNTHRVCHEAWLWLARAGG